jgi:hypothetical protein
MGRAPSSTRFKVQQIVEELFSESFDVAQDERMILEIIEKFPFMHEVLEAFRIFFNRLLTFHVQHLGIKSC